MTTKREYELKRRHVQSARYDAVVVADQALLKCSPRALGPNVVLIDSERCDMPPHLLIGRWAMLLPNSAYVMVLVVATGQLLL